MQIKQPLGDRQYDCGQREFNIAELEKIKKILEQLHEYPTSVGFLTPSNYEVVWTL